MPHFWLFVLFFLTAVPVTEPATTVVLWNDMKIKHTWHHIPVNWETLGHPSAGSAIDLSIVLQPERESALTNAVSEISDPKHSRYREFLSKKQVDELVRPSPDTVDLVSAWLAHNRIRSSSISMTHGGTWLTVSDLRVTQASQLLGASYQLYRNIRTNETIIRTVGYSLPEILHRHVQTVMPATCFSSMEITVQTPHRRSFAPAPAPAHMLGASGKLGTVEARQPPPEPPIVVPKNMRWLYGNVEYVPAAIGPGQNSLAVVGDRLPRQQDLTAFMLEYQKQDANGATFTLQDVNGNPLPLWELPDETSNVAVQYATAMAYPTPLFVFRIVQNEAAFIQLLYFLLGTQPVPRTVGISLNYFLEHNLPPPNSLSMCNLLERFGARGSSVLVASGDHGVGAEGCVLFDVEFPSSCTCDIYHPFQSLHKHEYKSLTRPCSASPWVTSVGGTQNLHPEIATPLSGGGFSVNNQRPVYQRDAVDTFLSEAKHPYRGRYNRHGRGYPDISAQAFGCRIYLNGQPAIASGTACAVSTAAGIISLLNDYMIAMRPANMLPDRAPLGFLNPWLYSDEVRSVEGLNDITAGSNPGCGTRGFTAIKGWDPVTGRGTLNFTRLLYLLKQRRFLALTPTPVPTPGPVPS